MGAWIEDREDDALSSCVACAEGEEPCIEHWLTNGSAFELAETDVTQVRLRVLVPPE